MGKKVVAVSILIAVAFSLSADFFRIFKEIDLGKSPSSPRSTSDMLSDTAGDYFMASRDRRAELSAKVREDSFYQKTRSGGGGTRGSLKAHQER